MNGEPTCKSLNTATLKLSCAGRQRGSSRITCLTISWLGSMSPQIKMKQLNRMNNLKLHFNHLKIFDITVLLNRLPRRQSGLKIVLLIKFKSLIKELICLCCNDFMVGFGGHDVSLSESEFTEF